MPTLLVLILKADEVGVTKFAHMCIVNFKPYLALAVNICKKWGCC